MINLIILGQQFERIEAKDHHHRDSISLNACTFEKDKESYSPYVEIKYWWAMFMGRNLKHLHFLSWLEKNCLKWNYDHERWVLF